LSALQSLVGLLLQMLHAAAAQHCLPALQVLAWSLLQVLHAAAAQH
jgi:hypothetical protein